MSPSAYALGSARRRETDRGVAGRVKAWVRERFSLADDDMVMVTQVENTLPGCPPLETVIAFWPADGERRHYKIFKPMAEVVEDDLPPSWMKDALIVGEGFECSCC